MKRSCIRTICIITVLCLCLTAAGCVSDAQTQPQAANDNNGVTVRGKIRYADNSRLHFSTLDKSDEICREEFEEADGFFRRYAQIQFENAEIRPDEDAAAFRGNVYHCNEDGEGIAFYVPPDSLGMNQRTYIFARTKDYGRTWELLSYYTYTSYYIADVKVVDDNLFILWTSNVSLDNFLICSRDFLDSWTEVYFQNADIEDDGLFVCGSGYLADLPQDTDYEARFISVDAERSSVIIGMYGAHGSIQEKCVFMFEVDLDDNILSTQYRTLYKAADTQTDERDNQADGFTQ